MAAGAVLIDGVAREGLDVRDRGLAFGDGVFRTLRIRAGRPLNWRWHYHRLQVDCATLGLPVPEEALLLREVGEAGTGDVVAKIIVTRGVAGRGYAPPASARATRIVAIFPPPDLPAAWRDGVTVRRCELRLGIQPRLAGAKTLNRLENVLARGEWEDPAIAEGLLADVEGHVVEATASNLFIAQGGGLRTPRLDRCGVVGAQRERLRERLAEAGVPCEEARLSWHDLERADEVFLTNSLIGAWPVTRMENTRWNVGPMARLAQQLLDDDDARA